MQMTGRVIQQQYGVGTKSERQAVMLKTPEGTFILRRVGGNAFEDAALNSLVGKIICASGAIHGTTFIMSDWKSSDGG